MTISIIYDSACLSFVGVVPSSSRPKGPIFSLVAVVAILGAALGYLYVSSSSTISNLQSSTSSLGSQVSTLDGQIASLNSVTSVQSSSITSLDQAVSSESSSIVSLNGQVASLNGKIVSLNGQILSLNGQVSSLQSQVQTQNSEIATLQAQVNSPTLTIWNVPETIPAGGYLLVETVPDTFDYYDTWSAATNSVTVYYLTVSQAAQYLTCTSAPEINCVSGTWYYWGPSTSGNDVFKLAEGCGAYVALYQPSSPTTSVTFIPNVSITYNPATSYTGACA